MIDKSEIKCRFRRSIASYDENARVQKEIAAHLCELVKCHFSIRPGERILEVGCGTGFLTGRLLDLFPADALYINDLVEEMCDKTLKHCCLSNVNSLPGDIEEMTLKPEYNLIVSASAFQWFTHPADTFRKLSDSLLSGGKMIFSSFGRDNLKELRTLTGRGLTYLSENELTDILSEYFEILHVEDDHQTVYFDDPLQVLRHLKQTGANATGIQPLWTKGHIEQFDRDYRNLFEGREGCPLTYHPIYLVCRKK